MASSDQPGNSSSSNLPRVPFWNNREVRAVFYQIVVVGLVVFAGWYLISNTLHNLATRNIATGYDFLHREAGFAIGEHAIDYSPASTYARAYLVGFLNTLRVSALGIVFATILGTVIGVARLSSNWLIAKLAAGYVEMVRNVPLLLQLLMWYAVLKSSLPAPRQALEPIPYFFFSNRGLDFPYIELSTVHAVMAILCLIGIVLAVLVQRWARAQQEATGRRRTTLWINLALIVGLPLAAFLIAGAPFHVSVPKLQGFNFTGGNEVTPEFTALLFGLTVYTAAFIAETVRAGIQSVPMGQPEAARALGLSGGQVLRLVVLPQALRVIVPPITSQYLNLTKNSSLAVVIGYPELVSIGNTAINQTGQAIEGFSIVMAVYLSLSLLISAFMNWYNKHIALVER